MPSSKSSTTAKKKIKIVFVHLDLGIGGAEQLVLNLAAASQDAGHDVTIVTSHCSQDHCFSQVKKPNGRLCENVLVWGEFLPAKVMGMATALCSTIRILYLSYWAGRVYGNSADIIVLDVLPTPLPLLTSFPWGVLFYCHFPDKLLTRDTINGEAVEGASKRSSLKQFYRNQMDRLEETTMSYADTLVVNSKFTRTMVQQEFPSLRDKSMKVLYPALDMEKFPKPIFAGGSKAAPIVSLNRFERKKNTALLLHVYALLKNKKKKEKSGANNLPPLVIAGGYDVKNMENVEYLLELQRLAKSLKICDNDADVTRLFRPSISDEERSVLFQTALCIVYTPHLEHFGIVPLEAMYAGRPVVAVNSGGPTETVLDQKTGFLCENTAESFCDALEKLCENPQLSLDMGKAGHEHVKSTFGSERFQKEWLELVTETIEAGKKRHLRGKSYSLLNGLYHLGDFVLVAIFCSLLVMLLRAAGLLENDQLIPSKLRQLLFGEDREL